MQGLRDTYNLPTLIATISGYPQNGDLSFKVRANLFFLFLLQTLPE